MFEEDTPKEDGSHDESTADDIGELEYITCDFGQLLEIQKDKYRVKLFWLKDTEYLIKTFGGWRRFNERYTIAQLEEDGFYRAWRAIAVDDKQFKSMKHRFLKSFMINVRENQ